MFYFHCGYLQKCIDTHRYTFTSSMSEKNHFFCRDVSLYFHVFSYLKEAEVSLFSLVASQHDRLGEFGLFYYWNLQFFLTIYTFVLRYFEFSHYFLVEEDPKTLKGPCLFYFYVNCCYIQYFRPTNWRDLLIYNNNKKRYCNIRTSGHMSLYCAQLRDSFFF